MQIYHGLDQVPADLGATAVTIGNFDGVHVGHQHVLTELTDQARHREIPAVAVTFDPHPAQVHRPDSAPELLMGLQEKLARLADTGIDAVVVLPYTLELAAHSAREFVETYFVRGLQTEAVVVGHDVRFGRDNEGSFTTLAHLGEEFGFVVIGVEDFDITGPEERAYGVRCSSTALRSALHHGDVAAAAQMLGRNHAVSGVVVHGEARGRELGFPTANLSPDTEGMIPADGVYAGWVTDQSGTRWPAAISVGSNPTFYGVSRVVEAHVIGRSDASVDDFNLYGQNVRVEFVERLRGMVAYEGVDKLVAQMHQDVAQAHQLLAVQT